MASSQLASTPASAAVDGNAATRWSSAFLDPPVAAGGFGSSATVSRVVLQWEPAYATASRFRCRRRDDVDEHYPQLQARAEP